MMKHSLNVLFMLAMLIMALAISLSATPNNHEEAAFIRRSSRSRFLASNTPAGRGGCGQNSLACSATKGSRGPDCCNNVCADLRTDAFNCGVCGKRCTSSEMCCNSNCVKPMSDHQNCGKCSNRCKIGTSCHKGFCDYA
ncbi:hypothetical protein TB2_005137 [Malus domestica]|uniref:Stigma-specific STIG1-like protein 1 n=1 Tax=Malus domestica TaxID=3750 RepID=A0A498IRJ6_MALDO|nr:hypothetical protein DVH24_016943 [Malus domestica]